MILFINTNYYMKKDKTLLRYGFTLIELLIVIAIIGVLASIVLASLNSSRTKGSDAAIRSNMINARAQGVLYFDANNTYSASAASPAAIAFTVTSSGTVTNGTGVFSPKTTLGIQDMLRKAAESSGNTLYGYVNASGTNWAAAVQARSTNLVSASSGVDFFCVDSANITKLVDTMTLTTAFTACP